MKRIILVLAIIGLMVNSAYSAPLGGGMWRKDSTSAAIQPRNDTPVMFPQVTVATLPTGIPAGSIVEVTDGNAADDCSTGGGATRVDCRYNGSSWEAVGDGQAAGSDEVQDQAYSAENFDGDTTEGVSQDDFYDYNHIADPDDDGKPSIVDLSTPGAVMTDGSGNLSSSDLDGRPLTLKGPKTVYVDGDCTGPMETDYDGATLTCDAGTDTVYTTWQGTVNAELPVILLGRLTIQGDGGNYVEDLEIPGFSFYARLDESGDPTGSNGYEIGLILDNDPDDDGTGGEIESIYIANAFGEGAVSVNGFTLADVVVRDNSNAALEFHKSDGVISNIKFKSDFVASAYGIYIYAGHVKINDVEFTDGDNDVRYGITAKRGSFINVEGALSGVVTYLFNLIESTIYYDSNTVSATYNWIVQRATDAYGQLYDKYTGQTIVAQGLYHGTKSAQYDQSTDNDHDNVVYFDGLSGDVNFNLATAATNHWNGRLLWIKNLDDTYDVTLDGATTETLDGSETLVLDTNDSVLIQSDGTNWQILAKYDASGGGGSSIVEQADCSGITEDICIDTDDGIVYYYDGDSVEILGSVTFEAQTDMATDVPANETDPIVGAITGIVKADGGSNISAAAAGTDYAKVTYSADCSSMASGTICVGTATETVYYKQNGGSVVAIGQVTFGDNDIQAVLDCASGDCDDLVDAPTAFSDGDATPDVSAGYTFITANSTPTTITDFDTELTNGKMILVVVNDANTTFDFTSSGLEGTGSDYLAENGEVLLFIHSTADDQWHYLGFPKTFSATIKVSDPVVGDPDSWSPASSDYYNGRFIASAAGTFSLPALGSGMGFSLSVDDSLAVTVDRNGTDTFTMTYLVDGTPTQGTALTSIDITGPELCVFGFRAAGVWEVQCGDNTVDGS